MSYIITVSTTVSIEMTMVKKTPSYNNVSSLFYFQKNIVNDYVLA